MRRGRLAWLVCVLLALAHPALADGFVRVDGKRFVSAEGKTFAIRGINLGNWLMPEGYMFKFDRARSPRQIAAVFDHLLGRAEADRFWAKFRDTYIGADDIRFIKAARFNTVRVPLHYALFTDDAGNFDGPGYRLVDRLLAWCRAAGLKVILDLHAAPGGQTGVNHDDGTGYPLVFYVPHDRRLTVALWRHLAARYADDPTVLGYDLLNEPISPYHAEDYLNPRLEPLYRDIVAAIRDVDQRHVVFLAASQWSTNFSVFGPPFDANAAYTYHKFWASPERDSVQDYLNFSDRYNVPLFLGETGELTDTWNTAFRKLNERFGIGWCFWTYKNLDSTSTVVSVPRPPGWQAVAAVADAAPADWPAAPPPEARAAIDAYLEGIRFANGRINAGYLRSLGLAVPPPALPAEPLANAAFEQPRGDAQAP